MGFDFFKSVSDVGAGFNKLANDAASTAGHAIGVLPKNQHITGVDWKGIDNATNWVADAVQKIPVLGPMYHGILGWWSTPFRLAEDILKGQRIDHALVDSFQSGIRNLHEIAPYAQAVISFVPGVGPLASSAIGASLAIAAGMPIDDVVMAAVAGAVPGGTLARAAFDVGKAAMKKNAGGIGAGVLAGIGAAAGIQIPPAAVAALSGGLNTLKAVADGQSPQSALTTADGLIAQGQALIPGLTDTQRKLLKNALHVGLAMGHAQVLQHTTKEAVATSKPLQKLMQVGQQKAASDPVVRAAYASVKEAGPGFHVGTGLMQYQTTPFAVRTIRAALPPVQQKGYDAALALHIGRVTVPPPPPATPPAAQAGHAMMHGARAATPVAKAAIARVAASTPEGATGARVALAQIEKAKKAITALDVALVVGGLALGAMAGSFVWIPVGGLVGGAVDFLYRKWRGHTTLTSEPR